MLFKAENQTPFWRWTAGIVIVLLLAGCATTPPEDTERQGPWTRSELLETVAGPDPIEGFNRSMFAVTDFGMVYIVDPLGRVYTSILPRPVIEKIDNVCNNLEFPGRAFSSLGSGEFKGAWDELCRFLINTTVGIAGIFDPAGHWMDIYSTHTNFGQMFSTWGIGPGCTLMLPFMSSLNARDTVGSVFDMAFDLKTYIPYAGSATALNRMVMAERDFRQAVDGSADRYRTFHELLLIQRQLQLDWFFYEQLNAQAEARKAGIRPELPPEAPEMPKPEWVTANWRTIPGYRPQGAILDTLRVAMFQPQLNDDKWYFRLSIFNSSFSKKCDNRRIRLDEESSALRYGFWKAEREDAVSDQRFLYPADGARSEKLLILLPGIGGNYFSTTPTALAELFYTNGWSVLALDNTFTWQFYLASGNDLPGFLPRDAANLRRAISAILEDLKSDDLFNPNRTQVTLLGYSLGAMNTLKIAELEEACNTLGIDRYVAINPPVDLQYALQTADTLAQTGAEWSAEQAVAKVKEIAGKALVALQRPFPPFDPTEPGEEPHNYGVPLTQTDADFLAALYFRSSLNGLLLVAHREKGVPFLATPYSWWTRSTLHQEIDRINFGKYAGEIAAPTLEPLTVGELYQHSSLRSLEESLARNPKVRVIHNQDDFLLSDEDRHFLDRTFGKRLTWFDCGGHLGNLYVTDVQQSLLDSAGLQENCEITPTTESIESCE